LLKEQEVSERRYHETRNEVINFSLRVLKQGTGRVNQGEFS